MDKRIVEINGVKLELDYRTGTVETVETLKVGDRVRVLVKKYDGFKVCYGVVTGFAEFKELPTVVIAYAETEWSDASVKFLHFNASTKDAEVLPAQSDDPMEFKHEEAIRALERKVEQAERAHRDALNQLRFFMEHIGKAWAEAAN